MQKITIYYSGFITGSLTGPCRCAAEENSLLEELLITEHASHLRVCIRLEKVIKIFCPNGKLDFRLDSAAAAVPRSPNVVEICTLIPADDGSFSTGIAAYFRHVSWLVLNVTIVLAFRLAYIKREIVLTREPACITCAILHHYIKHVILLLRFGVRYGLHLALTKLPL